MTYISLFYFDNSLIRDLILLHSDLNFINIFDIIIVSILIVLVLPLIYFSGKKEIIKGIGRIGTAVLAGVGAVDSSLNLYDRITGGGSDNNDSNDNKKEDKNIIIK